MGVGVHVELAAPPAEEQSDRQVDDHDGDGRFSALLDMFREVAVEEQDGKTERKQRECVPKTPGEAERAGASRRALAAAGHERRHRREVIRVGGVSQAEQHGDCEHDPHRAAIREGGNLVVESEHQRTSGRALTVMPTPDRKDQKRARGGKSADEPTVQGEPAERPSGENGEEPDHGDRRGEPDAERNDQGEAETDPVDAQWR